jgi:hypothetical protein
MQRFERSDEAVTTGEPAECRPASDRLQTFTKVLWDVLVPAAGECASVQGELVRARGRLESEYFQNGMANYYLRDRPTEGLADRYYGKLLLFLLDVLIENRSHAIDAEDVAFFSTVRSALEADWLRGIRIGELNEQAENADAPELTDAEREELEQLEAIAGPPWEALWSRAERCIANWCIESPTLVDRRGHPVDERGVRDVRHIFEPPPPPAACPMCKGRGWLMPKDASQFPEVCSCKKSAG